MKAMHKTCSPDFCMIAEATKDLLEHPLLRHTFLGWPVLQLFQGVNLDSFILILTNIYIKYNYYTLFV